MKLKIKNLFVQACFVAGGVMALTSCNDFLDREPLSSVTPEVYFQTVDHFAAYSIARYQNYFPSHGGYGAGIANNDGGTDNMVAGGRSSRYVKGLWKVPSSDGNWSFSNIRYCNYFFENAVPKYEAGEVAGADADIRHYIGEMHLMRALVYYNLLRTYGDFPIVTEVLPDDKTVLMEKGVRQPRNLVARFILKDLDDAANMMYSKGFKNNTRLNRETALLIKSRVALYEASFERYHKGTGRVPGDDNWPGKKVHSNFSLDVEAEVDFFLTEAMKAAEEVADKITLTPNTKVEDPASPSITSGWNPYFEMFSQPDLSNVEEVLLWKQYNLSLTVSHCVGARLKNGDRTGLTRSLIKTFLMKDGLPIYASNSTMDDRTVSDEKKDRDERLQLFVWGEKDAWMTDERADTVKNYNKDQAGNSVTNPVPVPWVKSTVISDQEQTRDITGYRSRKFYPYDDEQSKSDELLGTNACPIFRASEAYLNYIEACYEKNGTLDSKAQEYWKAIRRRAGVDEDYQKTIARTDLGREDDLGVYSGDRMVDATLYNIRRERRCEFIAEGMRWDDLKRWRSWDRLFTEPYIVEGINFWDEAYKLYTTVDKDGNEKSAVVADGSTSANMSPKSDGKYVRPLRRTQTNNQLYDGYTWKKAYYLEPLGLQDLQLSATNPEDINTSMMYQNPYWPAGTGKALE